MSHKSLTGLGLLLALAALGLLFAGCGDGRDSSLLGPSSDGPTTMISPPETSDVPNPANKPARPIDGQPVLLPPVPEAPAVPGEAIITLLPGDDIETFNAAWGTTTIQVLEGNAAALVDLPPGYTAFDLSGEMIESGDCLWAEPNYLSEAPEGRQGTIPFYEGDHIFGDVTDQDALKRIGISAAHMTATGSGVTVAVLDTGIDHLHPDLAASVSALGWDFIDDDPVALDERNNLDDDGDGDVDEGAGHGTHVAGLVLAAAPDVTLLAVRVLDSEGMGTSVGVARGIRWARQNGADVINLSLGMYVDSRVIRDAIEEADELGIIVVNSAGNRGIQDNSHFPARINPVLSIASTDPLDSKAPFSNFGSKVDVGAPGVGILSTFLDNGYAVWSGTSMSTPLVSGAVALCLQVNPGATLDTIREGLEETSAPLTGEVGSIWEGKMGEGRIAVNGLLAHQ